MDDAHPSELSGAASSSTSKAKLRGAGKASRYKVIFTENRKLSNHSDFRMVIFAQRRNKKT
jgi:hypothetical protein